MQQLAALLSIAALWTSDAPAHNQTAGGTQIVRVFVLAGQSNMEGQGVVDLDHEQHYNGGRGILKTVMQEPDKAASFAHIVNADGSWRERADVFVRFRARHGLMTGPLGIGFTGYPGRHHIGPEFQFGHVIGDAVKEPVLLIKTAWGGKSLFRDFRPPSSGGETGPFYRQMVREIHEALAACATDFPTLKNRSPRLDGFVWMQGWNDMIDDEATKEYARNLSNLIGDVRKDLGRPNLPVVIGELGNGGRQASEKMQAFRAAQREGVRLARKTDSASDASPRILFVPTASFARPAEQSPNVGHGHHWFGNAESYFLIGDALGEAMLEAMQWPGRRVLRDIPYRSGAVTSHRHERCRLDVYTPDRSPAQLLRTPVLVWFHGGGLTSNSKDAHEAKLVGRTMADLGVRCVVPSYRLSPGATYPAYVEDAAAAVAWTLSEYARTERPIFVGGHSAGAYLTMMVGLDDSYLAAHDRSPSEIAGWLPVSAQVDSHWTVRKERGIPREKQVIDESAPLFHVRADTTPMLIVVADNDLRGRAAMNRRFVEKMRQVGHAEVQFVVIPDRNHVSLITRMNQPDDPVASRLVEFIRQTAQATQPVR